MEAADLAWLLAAFGLVSLMFPGLAIYYAGMLGTKSALNAVVMVMSSLGVAAVLYVLFGQGMVSGNSLGGLGIIGNPVEQPLLSAAQTAEGTGGAELAYWAAFFILFAAITIAIVSSGAAGRMKLSAWLVFSAIWLTLVYFPVAHWVFAVSDDETGLVGGWLRNVVELHDFAGGTAVHMNAGVAALALAWVLGPRRDQSEHPHNLPLVVLGASILWFGWFGFNGGSAGGANFLAQYVVLNTLLAGCTGMIGYLVVERLWRGHATALGLVTGVLAGLVGITPAADAVSPLGASLLGIAAGGVVCWALTWKNKLHIDDTLDAFAVHGVGGVVGTGFVVLFGSALAPAGVTGVLLGGDPSIIWREALAVAVTCVYSFVMTALIAWVLKKTMGIRVTEAEEDAGLDESLQAETAYVL